MQPEWFAGRRCLDAGCNEGLLTLELAARFGCASMLGLDIDAALVHKAARALREARAEATAKLQQPGLPERQGQLQALRTRVKALSKVGRGRGSSSSKGRAEAKAGCRGGGHPRPVPPPRRTPPDPPATLGRAGSAAQPRGARLDRQPALPPPP
jgi:hypothetical protein